MVVIAAEGVVMEVIVREVVRGHKGEREEGCVWCGVVVVVISCSKAYGIFPPPPPPPPPPMADKR